MHLDEPVVLAGAVVGFAVGLTGTGGGALMTPVLVLFLGIHPGAAISSDLVATLFVKPIGALVHIRQSTVRWPIVRLLAIGSVPTAFLGAFAANTVASGPALQRGLGLALGAVVLLAVAAMVGKAVVDRRRETASSTGTLRLRPRTTLAIGALGGLAVGATSVGSGSLMVVALMLCYPTLAGRDLVGTDLVQSVPLVASAAFGQALFGHPDLAITGSLVLGSLPATYAGARISASTHPTPLLRPAITSLVFLSALKLEGLSNVGVAATAGTCIAAGLAYGARRRSSARRFRGLGGSRIGSDPTDHDHAASTAATSPVDQERG